MKRNAGDYANDIVFSMEQANQFIEGLTKEEFFQDKKTNFAVTRCLEIVGEVANKIPKDLKESNPENPWQEIIGMRNKIIHEYFGVDLNIVCLTCKEDIPQLLPQFRKIQDSLFNK